MEPTLGTQHLGPFSKFQYREKKNCDFKEEPQKSVELYFWHLNNKNKIWKKYKKNIG